MLVPTPPKHGLHRRAFLQTLTSALLVATPTLPALAAYTIVPTGSIADKRARQLEVAKELKVTPEDPYLFGETAQLEFDIAKLENNTKYINRVRPRVESGEQRFSTRLSVPVPDMAVAVTFWTAGCGALLLDTRIVDGRNVTRIGYGPESLRKDDGGKFSLELIESAEPSLMGAENAVVQYIQLGIPVFRLSRVMATGGEIVSAYGWTELVAPGGIPLRVQIDENRRDPFQFVALRCNDLEATKKHYAAHGMAVQQVEASRKKISFSINSNSLYENTDAFEPEREKQSILMGYDEKLDSTGLLLLPPKSRSKLDKPNPNLQLSVVGSKLSTAPPEVSPDGLRSVFVAEKEFETALTQTAIYVPPMEVIEFIPKMIN
tara:strand:- start:127 stop:1254 length:1128 start_codon:yes stop_codon:yes gene_type:complete|eukprot:scaffold24322_cov81-Phaeocystis_antarctica.AAC.7